MKRKNKAKTKFPEPQKANECLANIAARTAAEPEMLFDEFWREGELAMMFGASGTGKSILAVQIGEALARGRALDGFRMPRTRRQKVLYVDLDTSAKRFRTRYSTPSVDGALEPRLYRFAENFYRDTPPSIGKLIEWLREMVRERGFRVVIIDSLAAVRTATDGAKE
ncbi:MAG TPA: AAA family ATPase, partial [Pyrinomonadaceae bacterium]|nr:AAA family ATPase [Pyrinomonadaceae bacterium]